MGFQRRRLELGQADSERGHWSLRQIERYLLGRDEPAGLIAAGIAAGIAIGMFPLIGLQTVIALAVAFLFRLPRLDVWLSTYVMNPWTIVPILGFEHWLGRLVLGLAPGQGGIAWGELLHGSIAKAFRSLGSVDLEALGVGGLLVSLLCGIAGFFVTRAAIVQWRIQRVGIASRTAPPSSAPAAARERPPGQ